MLRASPPYASVLGFKVYPTLLGGGAWRYCGRGLRMFLKLLSLIEYDYSIIDSTRFADWVGGCMSYSLM